MSARRTSSPKPRVGGWARPEANLDREGMTRSIRVAQRVSVLFPRLAAAAWSAGLRQAGRRPEQALAWMRRNLPACDVGVIGRAALEAHLLADFRRPVSPTAGRAAVQDVQLERAPWKFDLEDISVPVHVWRLQRRHRQ